ncbi:MAG TPA: RagB/SusD family nutrient uptake outer membrane protein [Longimicrobiales bacterium]
MMTSRIKVCAVAALMLSTPACDLDLQDPNRPTEEQVISSPVTLAQVVVGLQAEYSNQLGEPLYTTGMVTNELGAAPATFESFRVIDTGSADAQNDYGFSTGPWSGQYRVVRVADVVIANADNVGFGAATVSGIIAIGKLYKAMALGNLIQIYERIPLDVSPTNRSPQFADRTAALDAIVTLLEEAEAQLVQTPASAEFNTDMLAAGFDLLNTIRAMLARYSLIAGDLDAADAAAASVDPAVWSEFQFGASDANPLWNFALNGGNSTAMRPKDIWRTEAEAGDQRVEYWVTAADSQGFAAPLDAFDRYSQRTHSIPAYLPDEMKLIRAEVAARQNRLTDALGYVNQVRTPCTSALPEPVACLPALTLVDVPTQQAMLDEILRQRRYELYLQHLRWSDLRRFGMPVKYEWMPVSISECDRNTNTPPELCLPEPPDPTVVN